MAARVGHARTDTLGHAARIRRHGWLARLHAEPPATDAGGGARAVGASRVAGVVVRTEAAAGRTDARLTVSVGRARIGVGTFCRGGLVAWAMMTTQRGD